MPPTPVTGATTHAAVRTLLVTDLVGSTELLATIGDRRGSGIFGRTDRVARDLLVRFNGREIDRTDGFLLLFERPIDGVGYALAYHDALAEVAAQEGIRLGARAGIHIGEVYLRVNSDDDVARGAKAVEAEGLAKATAARVASLATARQTLLTAEAFDVVRQAAVDGAFASSPLRWLAHGTYAFKGVEEPLEVFEVGVVGAAPLAVPAGTEKARRAVTPADEITLGWRPAPGQEIPRRPGWRVDRKLGEGGFGESWLATHADSGERHVFKFCFAVNRLRSLRREVTLFRLIKEALGSRDDIARILDWQFDEPPFFLEAEYTPGGNLAEWGAAQGGLRQVDLSTRLELIAQTAVAVSVAHSVGVLHKDIKPANVLVATDADGRPRTRLMDFGIGIVDDTRLLMARGISAQGFTRPGTTEPSNASGTFMYMAPEIVEGRVPTIQADLFSLGVLLYQIVVGDFGRAVATSWPRDIDDELIREEIAALLDGDPDRRPASALVVAQHLRSLDQRRTEREREQRERAEAEATRLALVRSQARRRQFKIAAALASVVLLVVSLLAVQTVFARREAELRRGQAEDLVGFLLGDLRAKLRPIGRLDVLDEVGAKAAGYFDAIPESMRTDADLVRYAKTLTQIGQVRLEQGQLPEALRAFEQSLALVEGVVSRAPDAGDWRFELGQSQYWVGAVLRRQSDLEGAHAQWQAYLETAKRLTAQDPARAGWQLELGYAYGNIGLLQEARGQFADAVASYRGSMAIKAAVAGTRPGDPKAQGDLAVSHNKIATALEKMGDLDGALGEYLAERRIRETLAAGDPKNADWKWRLAINGDNLGRLYLALGRNDNARVEFERHRELMDGLAGLDPTNLPWQRGRALAALDLGLVAQETGDAAGAERRFRAALAGFEAVGAQAPSNLSWQRDIAFADRLLGEARLRQGDVAGAVAHAREALTRLERVEAREPDDVATRRHRAFALLLLGEAQDASGQRPAAIGSWERAAEVGQFARDSSDWALVEAWASSLLHLGRRQEAAPIVARLEAAGYRRTGFVRFYRDNGVPAGS